MSDEIQHHCHALGCPNPCPPRWLMCKACWRQVPGELQREVYRTVELRGSYIDETWAAWWRAAALAIAAVHAKNNPTWNRQAYIDREFKVADQLEERTTNGTDSANATVPMRTSRLSED